MNVDNNQINSMMELLDVQFYHCQNVSEKDKSMQCAYYDGMWTAYDHMLLGTGKTIYRDENGKHKIIELEYEV